MPKNVTIVCDYCESDLSDDKSDNRYRLKLLSQMVKNDSLFALAIITYPPIAENKYFCNMECLKRWVNE